MIYRLIAILPLLLVFSSSQILAKEDLIKKRTTAQLVQIFKDEGYSAVKAIKDKLILIKVNGKSYILVNFDDGDLQLFYGLKGVKVSHSDVNEWNKTKRLSRSYIDNDGDLALEADLLANAGLSKKHITEFFSTFVDSCRLFRRFAIEHNKN